MKSTQKTSMLHTISMGGLLDDLVGRLVFPNFLSLNTMGTLNISISAGGKISVEIVKSMGHTNFLVEVEITWAQNFGSSTRSS